MELSEIASVAGKGGLFKVIKPTRQGVILESLDEKKKRFAVSASQQISILNEISIYTTDQDGTISLEEVFKKIHREFKGDPGVDSSSDSGELFAFIKHIVPEYDETRVYPSDVKKLVSWYKILVSKAPHLFEEKKEEKKEETKKPKAEKKTGEEKPKKSTKAKKKE